MSEQQNPGPFSVQVARTVDDVELLKPVWDMIPWEREEAEHDSFLARVRLKEDVVAPYAIVVYRDEEPVAALAARLESRRLKTNIGYRVVYAPQARVIQAVSGGVVAMDSAAIPPLVEALGSALARGDADAVALPPLLVDSELFAAFQDFGGPLERQRFVPTWTRRRLVLPGSFDEFMASRSYKIRRGIRNTASRLQATYGAELRVEILREPASFEQLVRDLDRIAGSTYQRSLGAGFSDTPESRSFVRIGLENGHLRAYVLYLGDEPIAYWLCSVYRGTMFLRTTGFDHAHAYHRVGAYLLMRLVEDAFADPGVDVIDFGPGDSEHKRLYTNDTAAERNLFIFAPTFRARRINAVRTVILGLALVARRAADATNLTVALKARWRRRLHR